MSNVKLLGMYALIYWVIFSIFMFSKLHLPNTFVQWGFMISFSVITIYLFSNPFLLITHNTSLSIIVLNVCAQFCSGILFADLLLFGSHVVKRVLLKERELLLIEQCLQRITPILFIPILLHFYFVTTVLWLIFAFIHARDLFSNATYCMQIFFQIFL